MNTLDLKVLKMKKTLSVLSSVLVVAATTVPVYAQTAGQITAKSGDVYVERQGTAYVAQTEAQLQDGDCITTYAESSLSISTVNGCMVDLNANQSYIIKAEMTDCAEVAQEVSVCESIPSALSSESQDLQLGLLPLLVLGVAATTVIVAATDDDEPASP